MTITASVKRLILACILTIFLMSNIQSTNYWHRTFRHLLVKESANLVFEQPSWRKTIHAKFLWTAFEVEHGFYFSLVKLHDQKEKAVNTLHQSFLRSWDKKAVAVFYTPPSLRKTLKNQILRMEFKAEQAIKKMIG